MRIIAEKVSEVIVGKNEAGVYEYKDTGGSVEMGDKAFVVKDENIFSETINKVFYKKRENAENHL